LRSSRSSLCISSGVVTCLVLSIARTSPLGIMN
jgi:hypothetical protein